MHEKHLRGVDLNLLTLLDALLTQGSVGRAATAANLSQPAMSRARCSTIRCWSASARNPD